MDAMFDCELDYFRVSEGSAVHLSREESSLCDLSDASKDMLNLSQAESSITRFPDGTFAHQPYPQVMQSAQAAAAYNQRPKRPWVPIATDWLPYCHEMKAFPAGFKLNVYDARLTQLRNPF